VDHGVLKNFEMSRSPLVGFPRSNGHGRRQRCNTGPQGNRSCKAQDGNHAQLRAKLIELIKPRATIGCCSMTSLADSRLPDAGNRRLSSTASGGLQVYADGADELVRVVDISARRSLR